MENQLNNIHWREQVPHLLKPLMYITPNHTLKEQVNNNKLYKSDEVYSNCHDKSHTDSGGSNVAFLHWGNPETVNYCYKKVTAQEHWWKVQLPTYKILILA